MKVPLKTYVVYPESKEKAPVVLVIHEIFGLSDWVRAVADQLAADGFIAVAPDFISGMGPNGGGTESVASGDDVRKLVSGMKDRRRREAAQRRPRLRHEAPGGQREDRDDRLLLGRQQSFAYAAAQPELNAAVVYYGTSPEDSAAYGRSRPRCSASTAPTTPA